MVHDVNLSSSFKVDYYIFDICLAESMQVVSFFTFN